MSTHADSIGRDVTAAPVASFLARAALWNLALFGAIRLAWIDEHLIGRLVAFQQAVVFWYGATPHPAIVVNSACSGADVMALCAGVLLSYPLAWRRRLTGVAIGLGLIVALNAVRIATLHAVASTPDLLNLLHLYVWPSLLVLAVAAYVFVWIRASEARAGKSDVRHAWTRFALAVGGALLVYVAAVPWVMTSPTVLRAGEWTAWAAAAALGGLGATAHATGSVLVTSRGAFLVTQECLFTPAMPLYLAAVFALPLSRRRRVTWLMLALPIFLALGVARVLVLALPAQVSAAPVTLVHGFYQLIAGAACLVAAAYLAVRTGVAESEGSALHGATWRRAAAAIAAASVAAIVAAWVWTPAVTLVAGVVQAVVPATIASLDVPGDPQGALRLFPVFQVGLVVGLWIASIGGLRVGLFACALAITAALQIGFLVALGIITDWLDVAPHALVVRAWALGVPPLLWLLLVAGGRKPVVGRRWSVVDRHSSTSPTAVGDRRYQRFWHDVGEDFPTLTGAPSTDYYFENEKRLISAALPSLDGCALLKTDLWDEAKNTRIMQWAADRGARVYGIDLSEPIVRQARDAFGKRPIRPVVSDVRQLPFDTASFDAIYSMGTVEHFDETEAAVVELARILKPGGRLILGVPNRHDPFLRPLFVAMLSRLGLYGYGYEKSYSRAALRRMLETAGLDVQMESGILFMPGWLRMLDLWCHTRARPLVHVTRALVQPFVWLDRYVPAVRCHGYLIASVGVKPAGDVAAPVYSGAEHIVDARGCDPAALRSLPRLQELFSELRVDLDLHAVAAPVWHVFPGEGGVTGVVLLSESHLTIHTYPETGYAAINLYCCRPLIAWDWEGRLRARLGARDVTVRVVKRG